jgi:type IV pilus assembly protein PilW
MIAMIIGLILTGGAIQIFISSKATYRLETALSRLQETGRFIIDNMSREIRMTGYTGCSSRGTIEVNVISRNPTPVTFDADNAILGFNGGAGAWTPAIPANLLIAMTDIDGDNTKDVIDGTDVVNVQRMDECGAAIVGNWETTNAQMNVSHPNTCTFDQNETVMVTDCRNADVFQITNTPNTSGNQQNLAHSTAVNTGNFLGQNYGPDSQISKPRSKIFFIAPGDSGEPAFYVASWEPNDGDANLTADDYVIMELADGVEDMQILYGVDTGSDDAYADSYVTADNVTDWIDVKSARINLLLRSDDRITEEPRSVTFNGAAVNSGAGADQRLRMVYSTTISLRNRLP